MNARTSRGGVGLTGALFIVLGSAAARAEDSKVIEVADRTDHVEILARGATLAPGARPEARGIWIDVALASPPSSAARLSLANDRTLKRVEVVTTGDQPRLSVLLHHDMSGVEFAGNAVVEQSVAGVVLRVPREPDHRPVPHVASANDEPEYGPAVEPGHAALPQLPAGNAIAAPATAPRVAAPAPAIGATGAQAGATFAGAAPSAAAMPAAAISAEPLGLVDDHLTAPDGGRSTLFAVILLLSACGIAVLLLARRRRAEVSSAQLLRVVSTCQLSPKVRVMLVAVGDREVLLSVSDRGASVLGRWRTGQRGERVVSEIDEQEEAAETATLEASFGGGRVTRESQLPDFEFDVDVELPASVSKQPAPSRQSSSPAVAGLLKLRRRGADEVASADPVADEQWARDLLSALRSTPEVVR